MDAGSINVKINGDMTNLQDALNQMQSQMGKATVSTQGLTKSFIGAGLAIEGIKQGFQIAVKAVTEMINAFKETEIAEARLRVVIGGNIDAYKKFASEIQRTTTVEDENVIQTITLAKTMGIVDEKLIETTQRAIGLSKAFNLDLNTATKLTVLATQGNYDMLQRYIPALRTATTETQKKAIVDLAMAKGMEIAKKEAQTFTGQLLQLENAQGDLKEEAGRIVSVFGIDIVTAMKDATNAITDFITNAKTIETVANISSKIGAVFSTLKNVSNVLAESFKGAIAIAVDGLKEKFDRFGKGINPLTPIMLALATATKYLGFVFNYWARLINIVMTGVIDLVLIIKEAVGVLIEFGKALTTGNWDKVGAQLTKVGGAFYNLGADMKKAIGGAIKDSWNDIKQFPQDILSDANKWSKEYIELMASTQQSVSDKLTGNIDVVQGLNSPIINSGTKSTATTKTKSSGTDLRSGIRNGGNQLDITPIVDKEAVLGNIGDILSSATDAYEIIGDTGDAMVDRMTSGADKILKSFAGVFESLKGNALKTMDDVGQVIGAVAETIGAAMSTVLDNVKAYFEEFYASQTDMLTVHHEKEIEMIDEKLANEIELIENDGMTKEEARNAEIASLEAALAAETDLGKKANIEKSLSELKKEKAIEKAKKDADKEKSMSDYKMAKAKFNLDKQAFETNKTMMIISATMSYLLGLVMLWANVWSMGPIAGAILGGIMTGVLTGIFIASVVQIATQTFTAKPPEAPAFATGGLIGGTATGTSIIAGENSNPEAILNQDQMQRFMDLADGKASGGSGQTINLIVDGDVLRTWFVNNQNKENLLAY